MKSQRALLGLLAVIAGGVVVIATVLVLGLFDEREHTEAWRDAQNAARNDARSFCELADQETLESSYGGLDECIEEHTAIQLEDWEKEHPDDVWE